MLVCGGLIVTPLSHKPSQSLPSGALNGGGGARSAGQRGGATRAVSDVLAVPISR